MRRIIDGILVLILVFGGAFLYLFFDEVVAKTRGYLQSVPCSKPLTYSIGSIDPRFDLTKDGVKKIITTSANVWNTLSGKNLLQYVEEKGGVEVHFVYDERQQTTEQLLSLEQNLDTSKSGFEALKREYDSLRKTYLEKRSIFEAHQSAWLTAQKTYTQMVQSENRRGGASKNKFQELHTERQVLETQYIALQKELDELNTLLAKVNDIAKQLNGEALSHNAIVADYNSLVGSQPREFEEGQYVSDGKEKKIYVYQFSDGLKLSRVLQHEFGHAIGLDHVDTEGAIMYPLNTGTSEGPVEADRIELNRICAKK